jgi:hypothetical protein
MSRTKHASRSVRSSNRSAAATDSSRPTDHEATGAHAQVGFDGWQADYPSESGLLTVQFACRDWTPADPSRSTDPSFFCDRSLDRLMTRASQVQIVNPPAARALWQEVERKLLPAAAVVPTYNPQAFDFLAKHVGRLPLSSAVGPLVDQLWLR